MNDASWMVPRFILYPCSSNCRWSSSQMRWIFPFSVRFSRNNQTVDRSGILSGYPRKCQKESRSVARSSTSCSVEMLRLTGRRAGSLTERSKVQCLQTLMCRQEVRRRLRDRPAGISVLSPMHIRWYNHPISQCIHANIREETIPSTSF